MSQRTRPWRRLHRPWITAVLLALLAADAWWVLRARPYGHESRAALALAGPVVAQRPGLSQRFLIRDEPAHATEGARSLRLLDEDLSSWDELARLATAEPHRVAMVRPHFGVRRTGLWALTREDRIDEVRIEPWEPGTFDDIPATTVRSLLRDTDPRWQGDPTGPLDQSSSRTLWLGYLHNAAALLALVAFALSLGWVPHIPPAYRARRGRRRLARGVCPRCRYHLAGLEAQQCPECGERWGSAAAMEDEHAPAASASPPRTSA